MRLGFVRKLATRSMTGLIYAILVVGSILLGPEMMGGAFAIMAGICATELCRMARTAGHATCDMVAVGFSAALPIMASGALSRLISGWRDIAPVMIISILALALLMTCIWLVLDGTSDAVGAVCTLAIPTYCGIGLAAPVAIAASGHGPSSPWLAFTIIMSIWVSDIGAYLIGTVAGKHKLCPNISPKKTVEGLVAGLVTGTATWVLAQGGLLDEVMPFAIPSSFTGFDISMPMVIGFACCVAGVFGDLAESRIKREVGVKDSGDLMPGHGGMMDRCDSLILGSIATWCLLLMMGTI